MCDLMLFWGENESKENSNKSSNNQFITVLIRFHIIFAYLQKKLKYQELPRSEEPFNHHLECGFSTQACN